MGRHRLYHFEPKLVRDTLKEAKIQSEKVHAEEQKLIEILRRIDRHRFFVRFGYKSLRTYCTQDLKFTRIQAQRIVTSVRRDRTLSDIEEPP